MVTYSEEKPVKQKNHTDDRYRCDSVDLCLLYTRILVRIQTV